MVPLTLFRKLAAKASPTDVLLYCFIAMALLTLIIGIIRSRKAFFASIPALIYIIISMLVFSSWAKGAVKVVLIALAGWALILHLIVHRGKKRKEGDEEKTETEVSPVLKRITWIYLGVVLLLTTIFLLDDLSGFAGTLLVWESPVSQGFGASFRDGTGILSYLGRRFIWDDGLMSSGEKSLFYGAPTYALFHFLGFNRWTLRIVSVILTLLSIVAAHSLGKRFFGRLVGSVLAIVVALNVCVLFYGRYGTLSSGTFLAALLAIYFVWLFLDNNQPKWWMAPACAVALFLASLQYATVRLLILILLAYIPYVCVIEWRKFSLRRGIGLVVLALLVVGVWRFEKYKQSEQAFLRARGEQFMTFLTDPYYYREFTGRRIDPALATSKDKMDLLRGVLKKTIPEYFWFVSPQREVSVGAILGGDPPRLPLYAAPLFPFLALGLGYSVVRLFQRRHSLLVGWVVLATGPLLLTNRVDAHRIMLFVIPFCIWIAFGISQAVRIMKQGRVPVLLQHVFAVVLILVLTWANSLLLFWDSPPNSLAADALCEELQNMDGPIQAAFYADHREKSMVNLALLERMRRNPENKGRMFPDNIIEDLTDGRMSDPAQARSRILQVVPFLEESSLVLAPSSQYGTLSARLPSSGYNAVEMTKKGYRFLLIPQGRPNSQIDVSTIKTATDDGETPPLPVWKGKRIWLDELEAKDVKFGFEPPQKNASWNKVPMKMADTVYAHGIGMHAPCESTYDVPEGAVAFQAIIGYSDAVKDRGNIEMVFEVLDENDKQLFYSGVVTPAKGPLPLHIELKGAKQIRLNVAEGRDGRDSDHANWAEAAFLMPSEQ